MPLLLFITKKLIDKRSLREHRTFEIFLKLLSKEDVRREEQVEIARLSYLMVLSFEEAIEDLTFGVDDIKKKLDLLKKTGGADLRSKDSHRD